jgi:hypothetical protein
MVHWLLTLFSISIQCALVFCSQTMVPVWYGDFANFKDWNLTRSYGEENRKFIRDPIGGDSVVMQVEYAKGSYAGLREPSGTQMVIKPFNKGAERASLEYNVLFPNDFDFVKGGKIPGSCL